MIGQKWILKQVRRTVGTQPILDAFYNSQLTIDAGEPRAGNLKLLQGNPYARYLMPLEYEPSRDLRPRWGHGRPPHAGLLKLLSSNESDYGEFVAHLKELRPSLGKIPRTFTNESAPNPGWIGGAFTALDLAIIYGMVVKHRPRTYLEIGSGVSTCFARRAIVDHQLPTRIVSIDPEPRASIDAICDEVIREGLETTDLGMFARLEPGDIVFMDGSHRSFMNSDVTVFMLDVLPKLKPGVIVHFHDIVMPDDYAPMFVHWYWNEQYLLAIYLLAAQDRVKILMPSHYVSRYSALRSELVEPLVDLGPQSESFHHGGSMWFTHLPS